MLKTEFYGSLVYQIRRIIGNNESLEMFKKVVRGLSRKVFLFLLENLCYSYSLEAH